MEQQVEPVGPVTPARRPGRAGRAGLVLLVLALVAGGVLTVRRLTVRHPACGPDVPSPDSTYAGEDSLGKGLQGRRNGHKLNSRTVFGAALECGAQGFFGRIALGKDVTTQARHPAPGIR